MISGIASLRVDDTPLAKAEAGQIATLILQNKATNNLIEVGKIILKLLDLEK